MKCERCKKGYPDRFLQPFISNSHEAHIVVDPECALKEMTEIHGFKFTKFQGEMAQQLLEDFREWKKTHDH